MNTKGFTLIEVLIGLFIAVIAAISVAQVIAGTNKVIDIGRKTFVATNIAHEGLELTRQLRDNTWLSIADRTKWMSQSGLCSDTQTHSYTIDPELVRSNTIANDSKKVLHIQSNGEWTHKTSGVVTIYDRLLIVNCSQVNAVPAFVTITSTVSWTSAQGDPKRASLTEQLYNWLP